MKARKKKEVYLWEYESFTDVVERVTQFIKTVYMGKPIFFRRTGTENG